MRNVNILNIFLIVFFSVINTLFAKIKDKYNLYTMMTIFRINNVANLQTSYSGSAWISDDIEKTKDPLIDVLVAVMENFRPISR